MYQSEQLVAMHAQVFSLRKDVVVTWWLTCNNILKPKHEWTSFSLSCPPKGSSGLCCSPPSPPVDIPLDGLLCLVCMVKVPTTAPMSSPWKPATPKKGFPAFGSENWFVSFSSQKALFLCLPPFFCLPLRSLHQVPDQSPGTLLCFGANSPEFLIPTSHTLTHTHSHSQASCCCRRSAPLPPLICQPFPHFFFFSCCLRPHAPHVIAEPCTYRFTDITEVAFFSFKINLWSVFCSFI